MVKENLDIIEKVLFGDSIANVNSILKVFLNFLLKRTLLQKMKK
jgi:hypothetical protein